MAVASINGSYHCNIIGFSGVRSFCQSTKVLEELGSQAVIGIRPEFVPIVSDGPIHGTTYSTLPAGMETTVKVVCGGEMLTSVVFGSVDYAMDTPLTLDIIDKGICLFDKQSGNCVGCGEIKF